MYPVGRYIDEEGLKIARSFVDRVIILNQSVFRIFMALRHVWKKGAEISTPVDHLFCCNTESYRQLVNSTFFEKESDQAVPTGH